MNIWLKYAITALLVVLISEFAKRSDRLGALLASLPVVTLLTLVWLYVERQPSEKIANHAYYTFWYVIPTLPMFLLFPYLLPKIGFGRIWQFVLSLPLRYFGYLLKSWQILVFSCYSQFDLPIFIFAFWSPQ